MIQSVVKPKNVESVYGKCHITLSDEDRGAIASQVIQEGDDVDEEEQTSVFTKTKEVDTVAEDSDEEEEEEEVVVEPPAPVVKKAKKVVKKAIEQEAEVVEKPKKKVVKKKVVSAEA